MQHRPNPRVSVVIPTYNKARYLERSLASWKHQRFSDYELILVDDGSTDATAEVVRTFQGALPLRYAYFENGGRATARNRGLDLASGTLLVMCDDDRIVHPDFIAAYARAFEGVSVPQVMLGWQNSVLTDFRPRENVPARVTLELARRHGDLQAELTSGVHFETFSAAELGEDFGVLEPFAMPEPWWQRWVMPMVAELGDDITASPLAWIFGTTGNMAVQRETVVSVGGFDERFQGWGLEDTELCYRLAKAGVRMCVCRDAVNYHQNHPRDAQRLWEHWVQNARILFAKHQSLEVALYIRSSLIPGFSIHDAHRLALEANAAAGTALHEMFQNQLFASVSELTRLAFCKRETDFANPRIC